MTTTAFSQIPAPPLPRSSHSLSVIKDHIYIFGGEIQPRQPVDSAVHRINIKTGEYEAIQGGGEVPDARVGHTAATVGDDIYVFGGRGGADMAALEEHGAVYRFSTSTSTWTRLSPPTDTPFPAGRSYHCSTATSTHVLVHAGCAAAGRLNDLWAFDVKNLSWTKLADAPGDPRGGSAITFFNDKVYRMGGFNGKTEVGGGIDIFTFDTATQAQGDGLQGSWDTVAYGTAAGVGRGERGDLQASEGGPGARSVTALLPLGGKLVSIMGEGKPSPTGGHDAAGSFWDDVWSFDVKTQKWEIVGVQGPEARGWFAADSNGKKVVLWGGLSGANERLADGWILQ